MADDEVAVNADGGGGGGGGMLVVVVVVPAELAGLRAAPTVSNSSVRRAAVSDERPAKVEEEEPLSIDGTDSELINLCKERSNGSAEGPNPGGGRLTVELMMGAETAG